MNEHTQDIDELYEAFKPRLIAARRSYIRKRLAVVAALPIVLGVPLAWALPDDADQVSQLATESGEPSVDAPDEEPKASEGNSEAVEAEEEVAADAEPTLVPVELGFAGTAYLTDTEDGLAVAELDLNEGWTAKQVQLGNKSSVVLVLEHGDIRLVASISLGDDGEPHLKIEDVTPEPEPEVQTRKEIEIGDVGRVVVERDGEKLFLAVTWNHDWWEPVVVVETGEKVSAYFTNDGVKKYVEAWIEETEIAHRTWVDDSGVKPRPEKDTPKETDKEPEPEPEPEIQTRKEIVVGEVGKVVVERDGDKLFLAVTWSHDFFDAIVVSGKGKKVHAYFTNDGFEYHVKAWIKSTKIKHETWIVEPEVAAYDGTVTCGFGNVGVLVEGNIARVTSVQNVEGVEATILKEVGEVVRVKFVTDEATWKLEAWGNGEVVVSECGQVT